MKTITYRLDDIQAVAGLVANDITQCSMVTLTGSLGAGKTAFTGALLAHMGVLESVVSPTFNYLNCYQTSDGRSIYHFDLYRLKNIGEFERAGFGEYLNQPNSLVIIEWPEIIQNFLKNSWCAINIIVEPDERRTITWTMINKDL